MKVKELIQRLTDLNESEMVVKLEDWNEAYSDPAECEVVRVCPQDGYVLLDVKQYWEE